LPREGAFGGPFRSSPRAGRGDTATEVPLFLYLDTFYDYSHGVSGAFGEVGMQQRNGNKKRLADQTKNERSQGMVRS